MAFPWLVISSCVVARRPAPVRHRCRQRSPKWCPLCRANPGCGADVRGVALAVALGIELIAPAREVGDRAANVAVERGLAREARPRTPAVAESGWTGVGDR